jgi:peptidoglycan-associated lipoprotein
MAADRTVRFAAALVLLTLAGCAEETAKTAAPAATPAPPPAAAPAERVEPAPSPAPATPPAAAAPTSAPSRTPAASPSPKTEAFAEQPALMDVTFDSGHTDIARLGSAILKNNARWLIANPNYLVLIEGHSDYKGSADSQLAAGERRAKSAMAVLIKEGVPMARIQIVSVGANRPVCAEKTEACAAKNRRVHFLTKPQQ